MRFISFNGNIIEANQLNFYTVERFRVADACFESMLYLQGKIPLLTYHQERLRQTCALLGFQEVTINEEHIAQLIQQEKLESPNIRVRFSLIRKEGHNYAPIGEEVQVLIELSPLAALFTTIGNLGLYTESQKSSSPYASIKSANALIYVLAKQYAAKAGLDDVLIANEEKHWIEASSSNVFLIKNNQIFTSKENSHCVLGVSRAFLLNLFEVKCVELTDVMLEEADEIFLSNAVQLIQAVQNFKGRALSSTKTKEMVNLVSEKLGI
jgi:branched-subunit amino acid aminotransferase/4-amino-4-deoxychorismate lyase